MGHTDASLFEGMLSPVWQEEPATAYDTAFRLSRQIAYPDVFWCSNAWPSSELRNSECTDVRCAVSLSWRRASRTLEIEFARAFLTNRRGVDAAEVSCEDLANVLQSSYRLDWV